MKVLFFGVYNINDTVNNRTRILMSGLKNLGVEVEECNIQNTSWKRYWHLIKRYRKVKKDYDIMFLAHGGAQLVAPLAKILTRKKIVADPIVSLYDTMVYDRKKCRRLSTRGIYYYFLDWLLVILADVIILDTNENIRYFSKNFGVNPSKFRRLFIGSEDSPCDGNNKRVSNNFIVHFHGYFIPLHGIEYIIKAAKILENKNIFFRIIGRGQTYEQSRKLVKELSISNIYFVDPVPRQDIQKYICDSDVVLGIFGDTGKAGRVVPNKVYDAMAAGKALITSDTPAARELLKSGEDCLLCKQADHFDLASKILELKNKPDLLITIANGGRKLFKEKLRPDIISKEFKIMLEDILLKSE